MRNLAGDPRTDEYIRAELRRCRIPLEEVSSVAHFEVPSKLRGRLGAFSMWRAWSYWVVTGPMPLSVAEELYADPVGAEDVRVDGHCGCPAPPYSVKRLRNGKQLLSKKDEEELRKFLTGRQPTDSITAIIQRRLDECVFGDPKITDDEFISLYHIDSEVGLRLFADTVRKHGLDEKAWPVGWKTDW